MTSTALRAALPLKTRRDLRLASGLVLFAYVVLHLACHALGLVSTRTAEAALRITVVFWHGAVGTLLLCGAVAAHVGLALLALYERRTLRMAPAQALRIVLGLTMPLMLIGHVVATRYAFERFGLAADYQRVVAGLWAADGQGRQLALLAPGWLHGCLGLNFAFGTRRAWQRLRFVLFGAALLLPVLAGLGFMAMGRDLATRPAAAGAARVRATTAQAAALAGTREGTLALYLGAIGCVAVARTLRGVGERRRRAVVRIAYPGRSVAVPRGWSVLEASRSFGIAHQSVCGGRARCTTCRVRVTDGRAHCPPPAADERRALDRIDAADDVRLACQLRPDGDVAVEPLLAVERPWWKAPPAARTTTERQVAVLFLDVRPGAGAASAHDTIYALDRFHAIAGAAIASAGGVQCRHGGDGWMALFGLDGGDLRRACGQALSAAVQIGERADALAQRLARELGFDARFAVGVHAGLAVTGTIGDGETRRLAALGEAIDTAERLRAVARREGVRCVVSKAVADAAASADAAVAWRVADDATPPLWSGASARDLLSALHDRTPAGPNGA